MNADFKEKMSGIFNCNITEEVNKSFDDDIINEGLKDVFSKAKTAIASVIRSGAGKVLPKEWTAFLKGLYASAKEGQEAVAEYLSNADPEFVNNLITASDFSEEQIDKLVDAAREEAKGEQGVNEGAGDLESIQAVGSDIGTALSTGSWIGLTVIGIIGAAGIYRAVKAGIEIYKQQQKMNKAKARRARRGRR